MADNRVFISYAREDGEAAAKDLLERLGKDPGIEPWRDRIKMHPGDFEEQIKQAIESSQYMILVMTPAALRSEWVQKEWRYAHKQGLCVAPVLSAPEAELGPLRDKLPLWMSKSHEYNLEKEWELLVNQIKSPCAGTRAPFMAAELPFTFVKRPVEFQQILDAVLDQEHKNPSGKTVVLYGEGGYGKTTLAMDLCNDDDVITACDGGILWTTLGEQPSIKDELTKLYAALTGQRPQFIDEVDASRELREKLDGKRCLIVIDDVWNLDHLKPFIYAGSSVTRLITTRDSRIAADAGKDPILIDVGGFKPDEAVQLLSKRLPAEAASTASLRQLANRLRSWPLLVELANGILRDRLRNGDTIQGALTWIDAMGIQAFNSQDARQRNEAIGKTVEVSLGRLGNDRQRCLELGIFPEDVEIPLSIVGLIWGLNDRDTELVAQRISRLSLAKINLGRRMLLPLHDAMRAYLASQLPDPPRVHARLADAWKDPNLIVGGYPQRFAVYHIVEAMADPDAAQSRGLQLLRLLTDDKVRTYLITRSDLNVLNRHLANAVKRAARSNHPQAAGLIAAISLQKRHYRFDRAPASIFDSARQGNIPDAEARLELFKAEPEWKTAGRLLIAWLASESKPAEARALTESTAAQCDLADLQALLEWVRNAPSGVPAGVQPSGGGPGLHQVSEILKRAGGIEGAEGIEPLNVSGLSPDASGFIAENDGPSLVDFVNLDRISNTQYLQRYISMHAANRYAYYRNRSLRALLQPVLTKVNDAAWVRNRVEELVTSALRTTAVDFRDFVPLTVYALKKMGGDQNAADKLEQYRTRLLQEASELTPERGKGDNWSHYQRRATALAEIYGNLGQSQASADLLQLARDLPKGFAGFRCFSALTLGEAIRIARPAGDAMVQAALLSAQAASHRIQDYPFCLDATAMVNAMRTRWFPTADLDIEDTIARFVDRPQDAGFCAVFLVGEKFDFRPKPPDPHTLPLPPEVLSAKTLEEVAAIYRRNPEELRAVNQDDSLDDTQFNVPIPEMVPLLAARFAAEVLAAGKLPATRRTTLIQLLVPLAASNLTALDTVLGRLLLSAKDAPLELPDILAGVEPEASAPIASPAERTMA